MCTLGQALAVGMYTIKSILQRHRAVTPQLSSRFSSPCFPHCHEGASRRTVPWSGNDGRTYSAGLGLAVRHSFPPSLSPASIHLLCSSPYSGPFSLCLSKKADIREQCDWPAFLDQRLWRRELRISGALRAGRDSASKQNPLTFPWAGTFRAAHRSQVSKHCYRTTQFSPALWALARGTHF